MARLNKPFDPAEDTVSRVVYYDDSGRKLLPGDKVVVTIGQMARITMDAFARDAMNSLDETESEETCQ